MTTQPDRLRAEPVEGAADNWWKIVENGENVAFTDEAFAKRVVAALAEAAPAPNHGVSVSVVMPSGHKHTLSHVVDYEGTQGWDCGDVDIKVEGGHLVTVEHLDRRKPAPAPDLRAAVEAYKAAHEQLDRSHRSHDRTVVIERLNDLANAALRSAPASREAGLDAELVAQAVRNVLMRTSFSAWVGNEPPYIEEIGQRVAAEYARLAAAPVTEK